MVSFSSDYLEGCHPSILSALQETNEIQTTGYGLDDYCAHAAGMIRETFGCPDADVHFVVGGTQANRIVIESALRPYEGVLCADTGHINVHETGAVESTGHKVLALPGKDGRITSAQINVAVALQGDDEHIVKPGMVYISLPTELGTIYNLTELTDLSMTCRQNGLYLFVDGARLGDAFAAPTNDLQVTDLAGCCDVFTVGGTKMGALFGEAIVINNPKLKKDFRYFIKRTGGMLAKGRLLGLQFEALMKDGLYFEIGRKAVGQAQKIREALIKKGIGMLVDSPTNQLFPILSDSQMEALEENFEFSMWERVDEAHTAIRICTSFATTEQNVDALIGAINALA